MSSQGHDSRVSEAFISACILAHLIHEYISDAEQMSWVEWISVLKLSLMWQMNLIHDWALRRIKTRISNTDGWITVMEVSTQLRIKGLRKLAENILGRKLGPLKMIALATECSVEPWLLNGYKKFVTRAQAISVEEEEQLGWNRAANLFRIRHRQLEKFEKTDLDLDIRTTFASDFANIAAFDRSPISYLRPALHAVANPGNIQRDETYYHVNIILSVNLFMTFLTHFEAHPTHCRWKTLYSSFLAVYSRSAQRYFGICSCFLLQKASHVTDLVMNNLYFSMGCTRRHFDGCL
jgi:hypothetical protein